MRVLFFVTARPSYEIDGGGVVRDESLSFHGASAAAAPRMAPSGRRTRRSHACRTLLCCSRPELGRARRTIHQPTSRLPTSKTMTTARLGEELLGAVSRLRDEQRHRRAATVPRNWYSEATDRSIGLLLSFCAGTTSSGRSEQPADRFHVSSLSILITRRRRVAHRGTHHVCRHQPSSAMATWQHLSP